MKKKKCFLLLAFSMLPFLGKAEPKDVEATESPHQTIFVPCELDSECYAAEISSNSFDLSSKSNLFSLVPFEPTLTDRTKIVPKLNVKIKTYSVTKFKSDRNNAINTKATEP